MTYKGYLDDIRLIEIDVPLSYQNGNVEAFKLIASGEEVSCTIKEKSNTEGYSLYKLETVRDIGIDEVLEVIDNFGTKIPIETRWYIRKPFIDEQYYYEGELGAIYSLFKTTFRLWSPTAIFVTLVLDGHPYPMERKEKGVFECVVKGNQDGKLYHYDVHFNHGTYSTVDPYALSGNVNNKESAVINQNSIKTKQVVLPKVSPIIYETSIRDFTSLDGQGTFTSFIDKLDYLKDLGITHIQLMPIMDFINVDEIRKDLHYNWGYDPSHYFTLEGSYSSNPYNPYSRVKEFKELVEAAHKKGLRVVLDVVYNHVGNAKDNSLNKTVPYYYYRYVDGKLSDGSFCGNDVDSTRKMTQKLILTSIKTMMDIYDVDGFRFDLMGIIDIETMRKIEELVHLKKEDGLVYGEGWNMPTALRDDEKSIITNQHYLPYVGMFNPIFRDTLTGGMMDDDLANKGYLTGKPEMANLLPNVLSGCALYDAKIFDSQSKSINALETHDNFTLWDKLNGACGEESVEVLKKRMKLLIGVELLSQGVPFIHSGMEICSTKKGISNSYKSGDEVNGFRWDRIQEYKDVLDYTKKMIAFRSKRDYLWEYNDVYFDIYDNNLVQYDIYDLRILINPHKEDIFFNFHEDFELVFDHDGNNGGTLSKGNIQGLSVYVFERKN